MRNLFVGPLAASLLATAAAAATPMDLSMIDRAVADFTGAEIGQPGGAKLPVDRRLRLASCQTPLDLQWFGRDQRSVQIACPSAGWRIYVAVDNGGGGAMHGAQAYGETLVHRGEAVSIQVRGGGFTLTRQGSAMEDGAQGEWIKVRATGERTETLRAMVIRPGQVGIELP
ncbi:flagella basal body P-ring formation protein FlgA [Qipengyuania mesophila]|uniref:flagella basal body P-ring formation protein FlgA n=1 Tax=Qipengyuania mesophila TaxID=2867246 RepID=UPI003512C865